VLFCAGVNNADSYEQLCGFVRVVSEASPVRHFVVHCRKALLNYSPADNRKVPPLRRAWAFALARDFPHLTFSLNGQASIDDTTPQSLQRGACCLRSCTLYVPRSAYNVRTAVRDRCDAANQSGLCP